MGRVSDDAMEKVRNMATRKARKELRVLNCKHCHRKVTAPGLVGMSLVCQYCKKPVNGEGPHVAACSKKSSYYDYYDKRKSQGWFL